MKMKGLGFYSGDQVPNRTKWLYSITAMGRDASYVLVSLFLITYIQYSGILTPGGDTTSYVAMIGVISGLVIGYRIFDALNDPLMGVIIEKCHFKTGKYKPWILIGAVSNSIVVACLFVVPQYVTALQGWGYVGWFAVFYLLWGITYTMNDIAYWAMLPSLTSEEKQRATITTVMAIFCSVGQFAVAGLAPILSGIYGYQPTYRVITIAVLAVFLLLQIILYFFAPEHERDIAEENRNEPTKFKDLFGILKRNDQTKWITIIFLIYYISSGILNALGINYFYFAVNYTVGSSVMSYFIIVYGVGVILAQFLFPWLNKNFTRAKLWNICIIVNIVGYLAFFFYGLPLGNGAYLSVAPLTAAGTLNMLYLIPLCLIGLLIFSSQGVMGLMLIMMMANTIEYNEWKFGERKEAVIFSLRPLTAKLASAIQQGVLYLFLIISGLMTLVSSISSYQQEVALNPDIADATNELCNAVTDQASATNVLIYKLGVAVIPMALLILTYVLVKKHYKIDEKMYTSICTSIKERKAKTIESEKK